MDRRTQFVVLAALARSAAEIAADIATITSDAAGLGQANPALAAQTQHVANQMIGTLMPVSAHLETLQGMLSTLTAIYRMPAV